MKLVNVVFKCTPFGMSKKCIIILYTLPTYPIHLLNSACNVRRHLMGYGPTFIWHNMHFPPKTLISKVSLCIIVYWIPRYIIWRKLDFFGKSYYFFGYFRRLNLVLVIWKLFRVVFTKWGLKWGFYRSISVY